MRVAGYAIALTDLYQGARRIALLYMVIGLIWITGSDALFNRLLASHVVGPWWAMLKGYGYVLVTGYLLYLAIVRLQSQHRLTQLQLLRSEQAYRAIFDNHPNALWVYDPHNWQVLAVNQAAIQQFGYSRSECMALTVDALCVPAMRAEIQRITQAGRHSGATPEHTTLMSCTKEGQLLRLDAAVGRLNFNQRDACLLSLIDISERSRMAEDLQQARDQLLEASRIGGLGYWVLDRSAHIVVWSEQMAHIMAADHMSVQHRRDGLATWVCAGDRALLTAALEQAWQRQPLNIEVRVERGAVDIGYVLLRGELLDSAQHGVQLMGTALDITTRKRAEHALQASEQRHRQLIELMPLAVLILRGEQIIFANPAAALLFGATRTIDLYGSYGAMLVSTAAQPADPPRSTGGPCALDFSFQERQLKKINGELFSAEVAAQSIMIADEVCIQVMIRDISQQKKNQMALKTANERLLRLSTRAIEVAEEERQQLSRELHDDIGQLLTFIKMSSAWIQKHQTHADVAERAELVNATAGEALQKIRNLALTLRPAQLDTQGLKAAMEEHLRKFLGGYAIDYVLLGEELQPRPHALVEMALFRIFQEALTNIIRHSGASHIEIDIDASSPLLRLRIVDDGCGFDVAAALAAGGSLGLHTMTERAEQLGGTLMINAVAGVGTEIIAVIPSVGERE